MRQSILLDTGPLVAVLNRRDRYHRWAQDQLGQIAPPLLTCESVISEACFLLSGTAAGAEAVFQMFHRKIIVLGLRLEDHIQPVGQLLKKYHSVPMSLADACLVRMSELHSSSCVLTLDTDFNLYRRHGRQVIPTIIPGV